MQNLNIFGDSWGCGAWTTPNKFIGVGSVTRKLSASSPFGPEYIAGGDDYFSSRFSQHYNVDNYSQGAVSNNSQMHLLTKFLKKNEYEGFDTHSILFIQTDPIRDLLISMAIPDRHDSVCIKSLSKVTDPNTFFRGVLEFTYMQLDFWAKKYNVVINMTGGCSDIVSLDSKYDNLNVVCDSFYKLIDNGHKNNIYATTQDYYFTEEHSPKFDDIINGQYLKHKLEKRYASEEDNESFFGYRADTHPSRTGIDLWINHMLSRIK